MNSVTSLNEENKEFVCLTEKQKRYLFFNYTIFLRKFKHRR